MQYIPDPDGVNLEVVHTNLTEKEAAELAEFIKNYKADLNAATVTLEIEVKEKQDLDFLTTLLQRLNLKWTVTEG